MVVVDEAQLAGLAEGRRLWHDDGRGPQMVDATAAVQARLADWRGRLRVRPLRVSMSYDGASLVLRWDLQAADDPGGGRFTLVAPNERLAVPMPAGSLRIEQPLPKCFRIRHDAADGSVAYSVWLRLPMARDRRSHLQWAGPSEDLQALTAQPRC